MGKWEPPAGAYRAMPLRWMLAVLVAALVALVGVDPADADAPSSPSANPHAYDSQHRTALEAYTTAECEPPPMRSHEIARCRRSCDISARSDATTMSITYTYDRPSPIAQVVTVGPSPDRPAQRAWPPHASVARSGVAAKTADDVAETAAKACSFSGATLVLMADGSKKSIEDIEVGDEVLATDPETGEQAAKQVEHVFVHDDDLTDLQLADGTILTTTEDHPYWSVDDQRFERADELSQGERVFGADGRSIAVSGLRLATTRDGLAYNLSVEGIHTYHVGQDAVLVHNTCKWVPKKPGRTENKVVLPSAEAAEQAARDAAAVGGRCRFRGLCGSGNHYHVDYFNNDGLIEPPWV